MNNRGVSGRTAEKQGIFTLLLMATVSDGLTSNEFYEQYRQTLSSSQKMVATIRAHTAVYEDFFQWFSIHHWSGSALAAIKHFLCICFNAKLPFATIVPLFTAALNSVPAGIKQKPSESLFSHNDHIKTATEYYCFNLARVSTRLNNQGCFKLKRAKELLALSRQHVVLLTRAEEDSQLSLLIRLFYQHPSLLALFQNALSGSIGHTQLKARKEGTLTGLLYQNLAFFGTFSLFSMYPTPAVKLDNLKAAWLPEFSTFSLYHSGIGLELGGNTDTESMPAPPYLLKALNPYLNDHYFRHPQSLLGLRRLVSLIFASNPPDAEQIQLFLPYLERFIALYLHAKINFYPILQFILSNGVGSPAIFADLLMDPRFFTQASVTRTLLNSPPQSLHATMQALWMTGIAAPPQAHSPRALVEAPRTNYAMSLFKQRHPLSQRIIVPPDNTSLDRFRKPPTYSRRIAVFSGTLSALQPPAYLENPPVSVQAVRKAKKS